MGKSNYFQKMMQIYDRLQDEESKRLFDARITYLINGDMDEYTDVIFEQYHDWYPLVELGKRLEEIKPKGIILYGCGYGGKMTQKLLKFWGKEVSYYCDSFKSGQDVKGKKVLSVDEVALNYQDYLVIIASYEHGLEMVDALIRKNFSQDHILYPWHGLLLGTRGRQYFDLFSPQINEVYVDAGAYDGNTIEDFCNWTHGQYKKIYAFEPIDKMCEIVKQKFVEIDDYHIEVLNCATWNRAEKLYFTEDGSDSRFNETGTIEIQGIDIDSVVGEDEVTFIKMDIEGSERKALEGAKRTIIRHKPRLAICIYHNPIDILDLGAYILELVPEYKLYIRQYTSHMWETVIYAEI